MPERDGYIAGVPCWVDTSQRDPDAAADFYGGLFGWELEDAMPAGAPTRYLIARLRGGDVAAVSSQPEGASPQARRVQESRARSEKSAISRQDANFGMRRASDPSPPSPVVCSRL